MIDNQLVFNPPIFLNLQSSLMSLLFYFHVAPRVLPDPFGPLSVELSPSAIAEANAAVNGVQQAKNEGSKKRGTYREIDRVHAEDRARANTVPDIRAWRVHSRAPPTTSW